jgi:peptidoglycan/LPS O-acetylase OafA/YrhL
VAAVAVLAFRIHDGAYVSTRTHLRVDEILSGAMLALWWLNRDRVGGPRLDMWICRLLPLFFGLWLMSCSKYFGPVMYLRPWFAMLTIAGVTFLATFSVSHLSTFYYEQIFIDWARRMTSRGRRSTE